MYIMQWEPQREVHFFSVDPDNDVELQKKISSFFLSATKQKKTRRFSVSINVVKSKKNESFVLLFVSKNSNLVPNNFT